MGHLGGGGGVEQVTFSTFFRVLGRFGHPWGQNGAKGLIMRPLFSHVGSELIQKYLKMCPPVGNKAKHLCQRSFVFLLNLKQCHASTKKFALFFCKQNPRGKHNEIVS